MFGLLERKMEQEHSAIQVPSENGYQFLFGKKKGVRGERPLVDLPAAYNGRGLGVIAMPSLTVVSK